MRKAGLLAVASCLIALSLGGVARAQEAWSIERFHAEILVRADSSLEIVESIDVDFGSLERHGIFREVPVRYEYDEERDRLYRLRVTAVQDGRGRSLPYELSDRGADRVIRIGDPDRTVSGPQSYRIAYEVDGALNAFTEHDELFWNVTGTWDVDIRRATARVRLEPAGITRATCFAGYAGSTQPCDVASQDGTSFYAVQRPLGPGEQLTIVAGFPKGAVREPAPILERARRDIDDLFEVTPVTLGAALGLLVATLGALVARWLAYGRDRRYLKRYYLDPARGETISSPFDRDVVVAEYEPPELLRPAEVGLLLDETADTKDLTATIVHLAVRGHLTIEELPATGLFGRADWLLRRREPVSADRLAPYEQRLLEGLFDDGPAVKLSELRGTFHGTLHEAQKDLYGDAVRRGWFRGDPYWTRIRWQVGGFAIVASGAAATFFLGAAFGWGIVGIALVLAGAVVFAFSGAMPSRTAHARELLLRILGFRRYMETAETERQRFAEREGIFAAYLPYAIVFGSVHKWAKAFADLDAQKATAGWYTGSSALNVASLSSGLSSMSSAVSGAISSTPGSGGSSGFSGGSAGGGGGGGGGGSW
jgi:hypothetical protein